MVVDGILQNQSEEKAEKPMEVPGPPDAPGIAQIENPSSFDFSIPHSEPTPSTLVCGVGETRESVTPHTEVLESPPVVKPVIKTPTEDLEVGSQPGPVSSTMSERLFEGDLPEGKGINSNILADVEELVVAHSLASLRGYTQTSLLEEECRSPEQVPHSVNPMFDQTPETMGVDNLEHTDAAPKEKFEEEPTESKKKRKGKMLKKESVRQDIDIALDYDKFLQNQDRAYIVAPWGN
ncbi:hypothetical protein H5410_050290 [Solanum commersonii]|uniref:Uncharacterized protein n=1 Tax=Solanum commersonii TaxID=4109 RepID=A0A9J5WWD6_SOLCO|nr:hypothetical protein H5410_050290 [Solanum commersonii]